MFRRGKRASLTCSAGVPCSAESTVFRRGKRVPQRDMCFVGGNVFCRKCRVPQRETCTAGMRDVLQQLLEQHLKLFHLHLIAFECSFKGFYIAFLRFYATKSSFCRFSSTKCTDKLLFPHKNV